MYRRRSGKTTWKTANLDDASEEAWKATGLMKNKPKSRAQTMSIQIGIFELAGISTVDKIGMETSQVLSATLVQFSTLAGSTPASLFRSFLVRGLFFGDCWWWPCLAAV